MKIAKEKGKEKNKEKDEKDNLYNKMKRWNKE